MRIFIALALLYANVANATIITIEPDDYAPGTDLSNISPYVSIHQFAFGIDSLLQPINATETEWPDIWSAPTGNLSFGSHPLIEDPDVGAGSGNDTDVADYFGLGFFFHQPVSRLQLLSQVSGYCIEFGEDGSYGPHPNPLLVPTEWVAFDQAGNRMGRGSTDHGACGVPSLVDVPLADVSALIVGAADGAATVEYDHLVLTLDALDVPEPATLPLIGAVLLGVWAIRRKDLSATQR